jgi:GPI-anchor transamidase subunit GAA1
MLIINKHNAQHEQEDHIEPLSSDGWMHSAVSLLTLMTSQATGVPTGNHGLFHR